MAHGESSRFCTNLNGAYVTRYVKTDHMQFFIEFAFLASFDAEFTAESNRARSVKKERS
jgi:hypothetical protein